MPGTATCHRATQTATRLDRAFRCAAASSASASASGAVGQARPDRQHEPKGPLLEQRSDKAFVLEPKNGACLAERLCQPCQGHERYRRLHRQFLQHRAAALRTGQLASQCLRASSGNHITYRRVRNNLTRTTSPEHQALLTKHALVGGMNRKGNCWDNAVMETLLPESKDEVCMAKRLRQPRRNRPQSD